MKASWPFISQHSNDDIAAPDVLELDIVPVPSLTGGISPYESWRKYFTGIFTNFKYRLSLMGCGR